MCNGTSPTVVEGFKQAHAKTDIQILTLFNCLPLVIFAFMYQINVPAIYNELTDKSITTMKTVLVYGTSGAAILYIFCGVFGVVAFAAAGPGGYPMNDQADPPVRWTYEDIFAVQNILQAPFSTPKGRTPPAIYVCLFGILLVVTFASPFCLLPTKDSIEEVLGNGKFDKNQNLKWTAIITGACCVVSCGITGIGFVATLLGATTNSAIGFLLPIHFYLKVERKTSKWTNVKICAYCLYGFVCISSFITLGLMLNRAINGDGSNKDPDQ